MEPVVCERRIEPPIRVDDIPAMEAQAAWCLQQHRVSHVTSLLSLDGRLLLCVFEAPDAESVRAVHAPLDCHHPHSTNGSGGRVVGHHGRNIDRRRALLCGAHRLHDDPGDRRARQLVPRPASGAFPAQLFRHRPPPHDLPLHGARRRVGAACPGAGRRSARGRLGGRTVRSAYPTGVNQPQRFFKEPVPRLRACRDRPGRPSQVPLRAR